MSRTKRCEVCGQKKLKVICITCVEKDMKNWEKRMVQKGKLEERKRILKEIDKTITFVDVRRASSLIGLEIIKFLKQLQKEIGEEKGK